jgi:hypothetical protein
LSAALEKPGCEKKEAAIGVEEAEIAGAGSVLNILCAATEETLQPLCGFVKRIIRK